jgi:glutamate/tyrosine decarboxylase-like PLP-dependent enzyme
MDDRPWGTLELGREEMRRLGYKIVDLLVERTAGLADVPANGWGTRGQLEALFREPPPEGPSDPVEVIARLERDLLPHLTPVSHPRFFAFVPSPGNYVGAMADALSAGINPFVGTWFGGASPAEVELVTIDWLRSFCGLPDEAGGLFVSGGSVANLTALHAARHARLELRGERTERAGIYMSDQTHSSVERALRVLGFREDQIHKLPADADFRLPLGDLERAIAADRAAGHVPFCVVANAGTTNTGAVDPFPELAALCRREGLWLHADGAYGAATRVCERGRRLLAGLEEVDSLSLDPHKWLFQPIEIGCVLLRDRRILHDAFTIHPEYLQDVHRDTEAVNFCDYGVQLTRGFRALKLWMTIQVFGLEQMRAAVERGFELAELAERELRADPRWEVLTPAQMAVVNFRFAAPGRPDEEVDHLQQQIMDDLRAEGFALTTTTRLHGRTVLRLCTINPRTTDDDMRETIARMARAGEARLG